MERSNPYTGNLFIGISSAETEEIEKVGENEHDEHESDIIVVS